MQIQLGKTYTDQVTGFRGVATGYVQYLTGCNQVLLIPKVDKDGKVREGQWFDEQRMVEVKSAKPIVLDNRGRPGPDMPPPIR